MKTASTFWKVLLIFFVMVGSGFADEFTPTLSLETNSGTFYYKGVYPRDKTIWKSPLLRIRTDLTPFTSYWADHFYEIHGIRGTNPQVLYFSRNIITEFVTKNIPSITEDYIKDRDLDDAVDGSDLCYPAQKGILFKELANRIEEVTSLPYHGKLCVISDTIEGNMVTGYRISILDEKTGQELQSFTQKNDPQGNRDPLGELQWVDDRYIVQTFSARRWTSVNLIDLRFNKITYGIESDPKNLISAFVLNGKVMLLNDGALDEYPLKQ